MAMTMLGLMAASGAHAQAPATAPDDFWIAIANDRASEVKQFLARGVSPNAVNGVSNTPLLEAIKADSWKTYDVLLADKRIDLNVRNALGESPLMYVAIKGDAARAKALIAKGAEVNQPGWTALHYAATAGADDVVRLLIENYAYIDAESPDKTTPLMMAVRYDKVSTVNLLLDEGADGYAKNAAGKNAVDVGRDARNVALADAVAKRLNEEKQRKAAAGR
jgi:ankyrin repeat protein